MLVVVLDHMSLQCLPSFRLYNMLSFNHEFHMSFIAHCSRRNWGSPDGLYECPFNDTTTASSQGLLATQSYFQRITTSEIVSAQMSHITTFCKTCCTPSCNRLRKNPCYDSPFTAFSQQDSHHHHPIEIVAGRSRTLQTWCFYSLKMLNSSFESQVQEFEQYSVPSITINHDTPHDKTIWNVCAVVIDS